LKKGILIIIVLLAFTFNNVNAQAKFGYVNATELLFLMPEMKTVEHVLDSFQTALDKELQVEYVKYQTIEDKLSKYMKEKASEGIIELTQQELQTQYEFIQKMQQTFESEYSEKQAKLLKPLNDKILKAIKEVSTEKGLNYIIDISKGAVLYWDEKDDVNKEVRIKLGIAENASLPSN
jgi:outer membrane protein